MDTSNTPPQGPTPGPHPAAPHRPVQPMARRPMVDGFMPRRPVHHSLDLNTGTPTHHPQQLHPAGQPGTFGAAPGPQPTLQPQHPQQPQIARPVPVLSPAASPAPAPQPQPPQPVMGRQPGPSDFLTAPRPTATAPAFKQPEVSRDEPPATTGRPNREKNRTGHAGPVGFVVFILLGALLLSPLVPGKIIQNFPFASSSFSTGNQSLDCIGKQGKSVTTTRYNSKAGAPITYTYATSTTQTATCNGQAQHATTGSTSQFNPLGLVIDVLIALAVAIIVARIWRLIFGEKKHKPRDRKE